MKREFVLLLALGVAGCGLSGSQKLAVKPIGAAPAAPNGYYAAGKQQLAAGNFGLAVDFLRKAARADPASIDALNALGVAYDRLGRFDISRTFYERALALDPNASYVLNNLGYSLVLQGKTGEARELLARAKAGNDNRVHMTSAAILERLAQAQLTVKTPRSTAAVTPARPWVERTNSVEQTLVLSPPSKVREIAAALRVEPQMISLAVNDPVATAGPRIDLRSVWLDLAQDDAVSFGAPGPHFAVAIENGVGRARMAARMGSYLSRQGVAVVALKNASRFTQRDTELVFGSAEREAARQFAASLPFKVRMVEVPSATRVRLVLGQNAVRFDERLAQV